MFAGYLWDFGQLCLYQGIPLTQRGQGYSGVLPDKITIFMRPSVAAAAYERKSVQSLVHEVVWHEIAHYFGFSEQAVRRWEARRAHKTSRKNA